MFEFFSDLPDNVIAVVLTHALLADLRSGAALELSCRATARIAANFLVWRDVAAALQLDAMETAPCFAASFGREALVVAGLADLPIVDDAAFLTDSVVHRAVAPLLRPAVEHVVDRVYGLCGAPATCARRSAALRQIVVGWRARRPLNGFFCSVYGAHGVELLHFEQRGCTVRALKLTGDPNVPAGELSVELVLSLTGHAGCGRVRLAEHGFRSPHWGTLALLRLSPAKLALEWQARDRFTFTRCSAAAARALYDAALPPEQWLAGTHRLARERLPDDVRGALFG